MCRFQWIFNFNSFHVVTCARETEINVERIDAAIRTGVEYHNLHLENQWIRLPNGEHWKKKARAEWNGMHSVEFAIIGNVFEYLVKVSNSLIANDREREGGCYGAENRINFHSAIKMSVQWVVVAIGTRTSMKLNHKLIFVNARQAPKAPLYG